MARKQTVPSSRITEVQTLVRGQVEGARKKLVSFEKQLVKRGRAQEKRFNAFLKQVGVGRQLRLIEKQAVASSTGLKKRLEALPQTVISALGVATKSDIVELNRTVSRISKRVDALSGARAPTIAA